MYRIMPFCRLVIFSVWLLAFVIVRLIINDILAILFMLIAGIWLWLYTGGLKIKIENDCLIKQTGKLFNRTLYIMLKNIYGFQVITFLPMFPAVIRLYCYDQKILIFGLNGRQVKHLEEIIGGRTDF